MTIYNQWITVDKEAVRSAVGERLSPFQIPDAFRVLDNTDEYIVEFRFSDDEATYSPATQNAIGVKLGKLTQRLFAIKIPKIQKNKTVTCPSIAQISTEQIDALSGSPTKSPWSRGNLKASRELFSKYEMCLR